MPKRAAVARSITRLTVRPCCCRSLATFVRSGDCCSRCTSFGTHSLNAVRLGFSSTNWYCVRLIDGIHRQVLHRLQIERHARRCRRSPAAMPASDLGGVQRAVVLRLQVDQEPAGVQRHVAAVDADERTQADHVRILQDRLRQRPADAAPSQRTTTVCAATEMPWITPVSCTGKNPFGTMMYSNTVTHQRDERDQQRQRLMIQHDVQRAVIAPDHPVECRARPARSKRLRCDLRPVTHQPRAHHRHQRQRDDRRRSRW